MRRIGLARLLWLAALLVLPWVARAADQPAPRETPAFDFDAAEFVASDAPLPPGDAADWQPIRLPDNWYVTRPGFSGVVWYRLGFDLPPGPYVVHGIYAPRGPARNIAFFLNGALATTSRIQGDALALNWDAPILFAVPPGRLHPGRNVFHVRVDAVAGLHQGLPRFTFAPGRITTGRYYRRVELQLASLRFVGGAGLLAGVIALALWRRQRRDAVMFWFGVTALAWAAMSVPWFNTQLGAPPALALWTSFPLRFAYAPPLLVLCLRMAGRRAPWLEAAIWAFSIAGAVATPLADEVGHGAIVTLWSLAYLSALFLLLAQLVRAPADGRGVPFWLLVAGIAVVVALTGADLGRWMGWLDFDQPTLGHFHVPFVLLAIGATIVARQIRALADLAAANRTLQARVEENTLAIAATDRRLRIAEQAGALARERSRIMADVHDGVGASLLGLLGSIQSATALAPAEIERRANEALQELRLAVDSLEPMDDDLGVVLGNVRHRLRQSVEQSGVRLLWQVGQLPPVGHLTPAAILAIQRILLEAIANALRHAQASTITVGTEVDAAAGRLLIRVADDGIGFDPAHPRHGRGLGNLRSRTARLGATVEIAAAPGRGTTVTLALPLAGTGIDRMPVAILQPGAGA